MADKDDTTRDPVRTRLGVGGRGAERADDLIDTVVLDRYLVSARLGAGAMGTVFRGSDVKTHRDVAIKVLHPHLGHEATILGRFRREARAAARLHHENVAGVLDVGEHGGARVIVLELAVGPPMREIMDGPLPEYRIKRLVAAILRGLEHAHAAGLVHRDLKPENLIVETRADGTEVPRIVDFGIAVLRDPDESFEGGGRLTASGVVVGTPMYMAPEQAKGAAIDHRIDLFALGVIVYELIAGVAPFEGSATQVVLANINKDPPPIAKRAPDAIELPLLELFARKLMARSLATRFASASDALAMLELIDADPKGAALAMGRLDAAKASAVIALPDPPPSTKG
jgi:serine/threonine-protein kinase